MNAQFLRWKKVDQKKYLDTFVMVIVTAQSKQLAQSGHPVCDKSYAFILAMK
jgi:hypothetical protein